METLYEFRSKGKFGYVNVDGETVIPPLYRDVGVFADNRGWLIDSENVGYLVNGSGAVVCELGEVEEFGPRFSDGHLSFMRHGKVGIVDRLGKTIIEPMFDRVCPCVEGLAVAYVGELCGVFSLTRQWTIQPTYVAIHDFFSGSAATTACTRWDDGYVIIDRNGHRLSDRSFSSASRCSEGLIPVSSMREPGTFGWVDEAGETVVEGCFDDLNIEFNDGRIGFALADKWGLADRRGEITLAPTYRSISIARDGFRRYCQDVIVKDQPVYRWGFLNLDGSVAIEAQFDGVLDFNGQAAIVYRRADRSKNYVRDYLLVNRRGETIVEWQ